MILGMLLCLIGALIYAIRTKRWEGTALAITAGLLLISSLRSLATSFLIVQNPDNDWTTILSVLYAVDFLLFALFGLFLLRILLRSSRTSKPE